MNFITGLLAYLVEVRVLVGTQERFVASAANVHVKVVAELWNVTCKSHRINLLLSSVGHFQISHLSFTWEIQDTGTEEHEVCIKFFPPNWPFHNRLSFLPACAVSLTTELIVVVPLAAHWSSPPSHLLQTNRFLCSLLFRVIEHLLWSNKTILFFFFQQAFTGWQKERVSCGGIVLLAGCNRITL